MRRKSSLILLALAVSSRRCPRCGAGSLPALGQDPGEKKKTSF